MKDYKDTLLMMKTDFPMRGNMGINEIAIEKRWEELNLYEKVLLKNIGKPAFHLHDGPPYANGSIHVGHALNKVLKDFLIRYKTMNGFYSPYLPGWDTHGLPIETALTKNRKINRKELKISEFRTLCEQYALEQVAIQKDCFKRLGILGEWDRPYITLDKEYEAEQIKTFGKMVERGLIFKGLKPIYWSPSSETALAEAEIEYKDVNSSTIYVAFKVIDGKNVVSPNCELVIWTTTPWTIPANLAICVGPELDYVVVDVENRYFIIAKDLLETVETTCGWRTAKVIKSLKGSDLEGITYQHPLYERISPVICGDHVTTDAGTGLVHTAPGHGEDDFNVGKKYGLDILCPVDSRGYMTEEAGFLKGQFYEEANKTVIAKLDELSALIKTVEITHSYPHDWRTRKPIIFRATPQWFASINGLKAEILDAIKTVNWVPSWGETRLTNMIKDRDDWCISRQRVWGVPIPVFYAEDETPILDQNVINHVADLVNQYGTNIWFEKSAVELLPDGYQHPGSPNGQFTKENDIMDVWFDSGTSHHAALGLRYGVTQADVYLEGSDQYRGWFNSSLSTNIALENRAPYKTVISHGFTLDNNGVKMSKSLGNSIDPMMIVKEYGADIFRLWVCSVDYQSDFRISIDQIKQISESYRKIRNTCRFLLGNLFDFDAKINRIPYADLPEIDQYIICRLNELIKDVHEAYSEYSFEKVYRIILNYITNELSSFYLDFAKDILYIENADSHARRSIQTVLYDNLYTLITLLTPIMPHTTDEIYSYFPNKDEESIYLCQMPSITYHANAKELLVKYQEFMILRDDVLKALEEARAAKIIGKSLNAVVTINPEPKFAKLLTSLSINLPQVFIVSSCKIVANKLDAPKYQSGEILIEAASGQTCDRCWQIVEQINDENLCPRCQQVVKNIK